MLEFLKNSFIDRASLSRVLDFEKTRKITFPTSYLGKIVFRANGGIPVKSSFSFSNEEITISQFLSLHDNLNLLHEIGVVMAEIGDLLTDNGNEFQLIPFAALSKDLLRCDFICFNFKDNRKCPSIVLWKRYESKTYKPSYSKVADSFDMFLNKLRAIKEYSQSEKCKNLSVHPPALDQLILEVEEYFRFKFPSLYVQKILKIYNGADIGEVSIIWNDKVCKLNRFTSLFDNDTDDHEDTYSSINYILNVNEFYFRMVDCQDVIGAQLIPFAEVDNGNYLCFDYRVSSDAPTVVIWYNDLSKEFCPYTETISRSFEEFYGIYLRSFF